MCKILSKSSSEVVLKFNNDVGEDYFEKHGFVPLPPYIKRDYDKIDENRYQTIYSKYVGSAASATAGLHFSRDLFSALLKITILNMILSLFMWGAWDFSSYKI
ncbi:S-adenosylmethionine:tRNA ribosyltransferase-isomerase [Borreliella finlandensis]|uniref:S-adenosylmethionine:tRNA ribosyltransferase-isomerase n=2 Tax=Borreliella finlandensis TaxID=498741 RepID=A0A826GSQ4_9SPIR|nr:S-adenosylmethionine:tRNA ribosyltransferase-isomerase [Borreliella finlandensis]